LFLPADRHARRTFVYESNKSRPTSPVVRCQNSAELRERPRLLAETIAGRQISENRKRIRGQDDVNGGFHIVLIRLGMLQQFSYSQRETKNTVRNSWSRRDSSVSSLVMAELFSMQREVIHVVFDQFVPRLPIGRVPAGGSSSILIHSALLAKSNRKRKLCITEGIFVPTINQRSRFLRQNQVVNIEKYVLFFLFQTTYATIAQ
jgi:hypothetical protein